ncbi:MAG: hypothetical protein HC846_06990 [Blastocatellia bacterium]|nr:hypothetical protein [Blastocatellia bacterium]
MQKKLVTILLVLFTGVIPTLAQTDYCFENKGLKTLNRILFTVSDSEINNGTFEIESYDGSSEIQSYQFEGTKAANDLTIKFAAETPEDFNTIKKIVWKLGKTLTVPTYGKNNETNKWSVLFRSLRKM